MTDGLGVAEGPDVADGPGVFDAGFVGDAGAKVGDATGGRVVMVTAGVTTATNVGVGPLAS